MSDSRHARVREIFLGACELSPGERQGYIDGECSDDDGLRREVDSLLEHHHEAVGISTVVPEETPHRFRSGELFANRYRIVSLLGEGGMGQVYRADDETLGVPVAVKVLPHHATGREQLLAEVRHAREVTHPAVCRVHDAGEWEGELYITMEYVAGEDLAALLRRIGRMPPDKVLDIARQLCAGLAASHARGVVHRDLKPGNILIDPEGHVRIADFGVAVAPGGASGVERMAGTPAYMAPELLHGRGATERSDLYSLGLVLYELATGRLPFEVEELRRGTDGLQRWPPAPPSRFVSGLDAALERAILWCLAPTPEERPDSALALAASLPGTDALSLAAEVRVTPSPEIVAASGGSPALSHGWLWATLGGLLLLLGAILVLGERLSILEKAAVVKPPEVLADRAREMVTGLGYSQEPQAPRYGYLDDPAASDPEASVLFWYRQQSERALPEATRRYLYTRPLVPDSVVKGQIVALLDQSGRLVYFQADPATPPETADRVGSDGIDWPSALAFTGLEPDSWTAAPAGLSPVFADNRMAWQGVSSKGREVRVEGAALDGRIVYLAVRDSVEGDEVVDEPFADDDRAALLSLFVVLILVASIPLAFLNLRRKRGDRRGARRLLIFVLANLLVGWLLQLGWIPHPMDDTGSVFLDRLAPLALHGLWLWLGYLALEPYVRRVWPRTLVSWSRALEGRFRDSLVGRSLLLGTLAGAVLMALELGSYLILPKWLGVEAPSGPLGGLWLQGTLSTPLMFATALTTVPRAIYDGLVTLLILVLLRRLLRGPRRATVAFIAVYGFLLVLTGGGDLGMLWLTAGLPAAAISAFVLVRFGGLLTYVTARFVVYLLHAYPLTTDSALWYSRGGYFAVGLVAVIAAIALAVAVGGPGAHRHRTAA